MNNTTDTFEAIARDAVDLLIAISMDLTTSDAEADKLAAAIIGSHAEDFCRRALALCGE